MEDEDVKQGKLSLAQIMSADKIVELIDPNHLTRIGSACLEGFKADLQSRREGDDGSTWEDRYDRALEVAMQVRKAKSRPWQGASNVKFPLLTTASIQFQARAYPAIIDGSNLVKGRVLGADPDSVKRDRADRIAAHMTWQLLYDMPGWEEDTDRLLLQLPIVGSVFRKVYYDVVQNRNVSRTVTAKDFVINYWTTSIESAPRYTHVLRFYPHEIEERVRSEIWEEFTIPDGQSPKDDSKTAPVEFLEQFCRLDLDEDGYPEPYIVTLCRENAQVVRIACCYDADTVTVNAKQEVVRIDPKNYFTHYQFIPSPDGSFYSMGFGSLLDDITSAIDTTLNQLFDAGTLQNLQGGFLGAGVTMRSGDFRFRQPGEWKRVDVAGGSLRDQIVPLVTQGPSPVLLSLLEMLINAAKEITSVQDVLTGAGQGVNTPATTVLAQIEQATKVMTGIFKRIHRSFWAELVMLFKLNQDFLDEEAYFALTDQPGKIGRADYQDKDVDVMPVSDPTMINDAQKAMRAEALMQFNGDPLVNQEVIRQRYFEGTGQTNIPELLKVPEAGPDPALALEGMKQANERDKTMADIRSKNASAAASIMSAAVDASSLGILVDVASLVGASVRLATDAADMEDDGEQVNGQGADAGMEGAPANAGVSEIPQGAPPVDASGMGGGQPVDLGASGTGGIPG